MKSRRYLLIVLSAFMALQLPAQDMTHFKRVVKELSSARYQGRGYARDGANKAGSTLRRSSGKRARMK
ncbi:MAG: hypothetical protein IKX67_06985 [Bacteroidales bacterium]|nr:hypothetical protein [Bacteroidales bacterium]